MADGTTSQRWRGRLVDLLDASRRTEVLVIGSRAGTTAALLCAAIGDRRVHVAVDDSLGAVRIGSRLAQQGFHPLLVVGEDELADRAGSYDRVLVAAVSPCLSEHLTAALRTGGVLVAAIPNPFGGAGIVRLVAGAHWLAGPFVALARQEELRTPGDEECCVLETHAEAYGRGIPVEHALPAELWEQPDALFAVGLRLPGVRMSRLGQGRVRWVFDSRSWCRIESGNSQVWGYGERCLAREVASAYRWWLDRGRPGHEAFGLTVAPFGRFAWYDSRHSGYLWSV